MSRSARTKSPSTIKSPFLVSVSVLDERILDGQYPFTLPIFGRGDLHIEFKSPLSIIVGENGAGKSTLLEGIASQCGFNIGGGSRNHRFTSAQGAAPLAHALRLSWRQKRSSGFFVRAESFFNFSSYIDELATDDPGIWEAYGGRSLHTRSHGESFMTFFANRLRPGGIYLIDEPEAALSPSRQIEFIKLILDAVSERESQIIIATHSPILMAAGGGEVLYMTQGGVQPRHFRDTPHFQTYSEFLANPEQFVCDVRDGIIG